MKQYAFSIKIRGKVQGVGFRYYAEKEAQKHDICGWVKNLGSGDVEVWAEGPLDKLELFIKWLRKGPGFARVDSIEKDEMIPRDYDDFRIEY